MTDADLPEIAARLAIYDSLQRYALSLDRQDWAGLRVVFADDARVIFGSLDPLVGADAIVDWIAARNVDITYSRHHLTACSVDIDDEEATTFSYLAAYRTSAAQPHVTEHLVGEYDHRWCRVDGRWRIAHQQMRSGFRTMLENR